MAAFGGGCGLSGGILLSGSRLRGSVQTRKVSSGMGSLMGKAKSSVRYLMELRPDQDSGTMEVWGTRPSRPCQSKMYAFSCSFEQKSCQLQVINPPGVGAPLVNPRSATEEGGHKTWIEYILGHISISS